MFATTVRNNTGMRTNVDLFFAIYDELREKNMSQDYVLTATTIAALRQNSILN
jgi:hypothetical protein